MRLSHSHSTERAAALEVSGPRPDIFGTYYREQIALLVDNHRVPVVVGVSDQPIPLPLVVEKAAADLARQQMGRVSVPNSSPETVLPADQTRRIVVVLAAIDQSAFATEFGDLGCLTRFIGNEVGSGKSGGSSEA